MTSEDEDQPVHGLSTEEVAKQMIKSKEVSDREIILQHYAKNKEVMDFKVRALDFLAIYIREKHY